MRIKHNIRRDGKKLEWYILETSFEAGECRWDEGKYYTSDWDVMFMLKSDVHPELRGYTLYVFWRNKGADGEKVSYVYESEEEAQKVLDSINEFSLENEEEAEKDIWVNYKKIVEEMEKRVNEMEEAGQNLIHIHTILNIINNNKWQKKKE